MLTLKSILPSFDLLNSLNLKPVSEPNVYSLENNSEGFPCPSASSRAWLTKHYHPLSKNCTSKLKHYIVTFFRSKLKPRIDYKGNQ